MRCPSASIQALEAAGREHEMKVVGIDGVQNEAFQAIKDGRMVATFTYGDAGAEACRSAQQAPQRPDTRARVDPRHRDRRWFQRGRVHRHRLLNAPGRVTRRGSGRRVVVKLGISLPQGCDREYIGLSPAAAWQRTVDIARLCEDAGFESLWINDHFQVDPPVDRSAHLRALRRARRPGHGHPAGPPGPPGAGRGYRNPALTAKAISSVDVLSGGRAVLGIGAGWKQDEWIAYGYGFPDVKTRLAMFRDALEVISRMLAPGRATYQGEHAHVIDAVHEPKGFAARCPSSSAATDRRSPGGWRPVSRTSSTSTRDAGAGPRGPAAHP